MASEAEPSLPLEELARDATHLTCGFGNVIIFHSRDTPTTVYCEVHARVINTYAAAKYPAGLGMLVAIAADEPPPNDAARRAIMQSFITMKRSMRAGVLVVEGEGFAASAKRSIIALFNMSNLLPFPMRVAGHVSEGAEKLCDMLGNNLTPGLTPQSLTRAATIARQQLLPRATT